MQSGADYNCGLWRKDSCQEESGGLFMTKRLNRLLFMACLMTSICWASPAVARVTLEVLNPQAEIPPPPAVGRLAPRVGDLAGKRVGLIANSKPGAELFLTEIEELLKTSAPDATVVRLRMMNVRPEQAKSLASKIDTFIHATGD
jgi:hypothetical protein